MNLMLKSALSITQVSRELNVSENTTRRLIKGGKIRASQIGQQWRVFPSDLEAYLSERSNLPRCEQAGADDLFDAST